uniref:Uncharacterized protein n=1 Tax=Neisseria meningitidis alpha522 TaxID=996307 RepID=I4E6F0_NEIME|nr:hypothetical protein NMALPHA522_1377 [Neisseria meningitidis alpha522]
MRVFNTPAPNLGIPKSYMLLKTATLSATWRLFYACRK